MSQKNQSDGGGQKGFTVGRGLLAAAKTLNCSMNDQRSSRQMGGLGSGVRVGGGGGVEGQESSSQMTRHGGGSQLGSTMKLFASLGLSPSDLDALAQIPEEDISVETLPEILMQLKSRKGESGERHMSAGSRDLSSMSSDTSFRGGRGSWDNMSMGRSGGPSTGQGSALTQQPADFGFSSMQDVSPGMGFNTNYSNNRGGAGGRDRPYSDLSRDSYGGLDMGLSSSDSMYMQRRMGSPSQGKIQDFLGVMPPMFPHVCSLCDFDVHSNMEWNQHIGGLRHAETRRQLLNMYPEWDPGMGSNRGSSMGLLGTPNLSLGLLGPGPMSSGQTGRGMASNWGIGSSGMSGKNQLGPTKLRGRVVVVKYERKPLNEKVLFDFAEPFGRVREHLILKNKAFLEMSTHDQAMDMVNYYQQHPASMFGKPVFFTVSKELMVIEKNDRADRSWDIKGHGSKVVFFANLPKETEKKQELLTIAERFGTVEKHLFLNDQAFVQLGTVEDAEMLVKYHSINPLTIKGRLIRLNICTKYKTLNLNRRSGGSAGGDTRGWKSTAATSSSSSSGMKSSSSKSSSSKSSAHSSRTKEEDKKKKKEEDKKKDEEDKKKKDEEEAAKDETEEKTAAEEPVSSVTVREEEEEPADDDTEEEEPESEDHPEETVQESDVPKKVPDESTEAHGEVGGAEDDTEQREEPQDQTAPMEMETAASEEHEKDEVNSEPGESSDNVEGDVPADGDEDILENMEDFVTLDEVAEDEDESHGDSSAIDNTKAGGMRVVNVLGFRRGYNFLKELLGLADPFGKVVKYLVLDLRPEAYLQFTTEEEARAMAKFYNSNVTATVCGRPVKVNHSMTYPTIQCGSSRVVYVGQLPNSKYSDEEVLKLAETFGTIKRYFLNRLKRECFIEMENPEDAEKMSEHYKAEPARFYGKRLNIYVSRKYRQLKYGHRRVSAPEEKKAASKRESSRSSKHAEEPPAKKVKEEQQEEEQQEQKEEELESAEVVVEESEENVAENSDVCDQNSQNQEDDKQADIISTNQSREEEPPVADAVSSPASLPLPPYDPDNPIGVEHIRLGFYCRVCFLFYSNEDVAKRLHCSSQAHYDKLQNYLEKRQNAEKTTKSE